MDIQERREVSKEIGRKNRVYKFIVIIVVFIIVVVKFFFFDYMYISGNSMNDTYKNGEIVLIKKQYETIERFDVVVCHTKKRGYTNKIIKRIIGVPNDVIQIVDGYVYINNKKLDDMINIKMEYAGIAEEKIVLASDEYFVLGDNRNESSDSRYEEIGIIKQKEIIGKVLIKLLRK